MEQNNIRKSTKTTSSKPSLKEMEKTNKNHHFSWIKTKFQEKKTKLKKVQIWCQWQHKILKLEMNNHLKNQMKNSLIFYSDLYYFYFFLILQFKSYLHISLSKYLHLCTFYYIFINIYFFHTEVLKVHFELIKGYSSGLCWLKLWILIFEPYIFISTSQSYFYTLFSENTSLFSFIEI